MYHRSPLKAVPGKVTHATGGSQDCDREGCGAREVHQRFLPTPQASRHGFALG